MRKFYKFLQGMLVVLRFFFEFIFKFIIGFFLLDKEVMDVFYEFYEQIEVLEKVLIDNIKIFVCLVINFEKMVIKEFLCVYVYLSLYNVFIDLVVVNWIIFDFVSDFFFKKWKEN